jgi:hypothetical protein
VSERPLPPKWRDFTVRLTEHQAKHPLRVSPKHSVSGPHKAVRCGMCRYEEGTQTVKLCSTCAGLMGPPEAA